MENNITGLFKAISFTNKKTHIPDLDDYIFIENGAFILQDAFKTYVLQLETLNDIGNFVIKKSDFSKINAKNSKFFIENFSDNTMNVKVVSKDEEIITSVPITRKYINLSKIINKTYCCDNCIDINGVSLKSMLKGYKQEIGFKFIDQKFFVSMNGEDSFIDFSDEFGELCQLSVLCTDDSESFIPGQQLVDSLGQFGLKKNNAQVNLRFNKYCYSLSNGNLTIYIATNKKD